ncbi:hypothetical protein M422DRAFT_39451, partial [Sphaerobolus stellatus SS14]
NGLHKDPAIRYMVSSAVEMLKPLAGQKRVYAALQSKGSALVNDAVEIRSHRVSVPMKYS